MSFELTWYTDGKIFQLDLQGELSVDEMKDIDQRIRKILGKHKSKLMLIVDVSSLQPHYLTVNHLRTTQQYMDHSNLEAIVAIANNKLGRLITMLVYNLPCANFVQFDSKERAHDYLACIGFSKSAAVNSKRRLV